MTVRREDSFPATSIGRTTGSGFQRAAATATTESLSAHPLLTSNRASSPVPEAGGYHRYATYTPRQRTSSSTIAGPAAQPVSSSPPDVTNSLQLVHLKAAAQKIGVNPSSVGWAILEKLVYSEGDADWTEIWNAVTLGKATLLLPLEPLSGCEITAEFVKDHVILYDGPSRPTNAEAITLSGLRGMLDGQSLTLRSTLHPHSKIFPLLLSSGLSALPPLPPFTNAPYPSFSLPTFTTALPLPPRIYPPKPPPLPPRTGLSAAATNSQPTGVPIPRISNPFASLFGSVSPSHSPTPSLLSSTSISSMTTTSHPSNLPVADPTAAPLIEVSAFTIDRKIVRSDTGSEINRVLKDEVTEFLDAPIATDLSSDSELELEGIPQLVIELVHEFTARWYPFVQESIADSESSFTVASITWEADLPERVLEFYFGLEGDLRAPGMSGNADEKANVEEGGIGEEGEKIITMVMERVERCLGLLFYDRLFRQPDSDDSSHDEALSTRTAALNLLKLGLEHLDVYVSDHCKDGVEAVARACGDVLSQLAQHYAPGDKAAVLVEAHRVIVDGLTQLPPIRLMTEEESKAQREKTAAKLASTQPASSDTIVTEQVAALMENDAQLSSIVVQPGANESATASSAASEDGAAGSNRDDSEDMTPPPVIPPPTAPRSTPTPVSTDILLPFLIYSVVKSNQPQLVSHLLYTQRFRNGSAIAGERGEEQFCLVNLMSVVQFLEGVDFEALGLGLGLGTDGVIKIQDIKVAPVPIPMTIPIPIHDRDEVGLVGRAGGVLVTATAGGFGVLKGRVVQANRVLTGVVDTSVGMLRALLPVGHDVGSGLEVAAVTHPAVDVSGSMNVSPGRKMVVSKGGGNGSAGAGGAVNGGGSSGFSIRSIAAALPVPLPRIGRGGGGEEEGRPLLPVVSSGGFVSEKEAGDDEEEEGGIEYSQAVSEHEDEGVSDGEDDGDGEATDTVRATTTTTTTKTQAEVKTLRSFESMLVAAVAGKGRGKRSSERKDRNRSGSTTTATIEKSGGLRRSLSDRLASVGSLAGAKVSPPSSRPGTMLPPPLLESHSRSTSPVGGGQLMLAPPVQRFMETSAGDLKISEVTELLEEYRRLVNGIRDVGGFTE